MFSISLYTKLNLVEPILESFSIGHLWASTTVVYSATGASGLSNLYFRKHEKIVGDQIWIVGRVAHASQSLIIQEADALMSTANRTAAHVQDESLGAGPRSLLSQLFQQLWETNGYEPIGNDCLLIFKWNGDDVAMLGKQRAYHHLSNTFWLLVFLKRFFSFECSFSWLLLGLWIILVDPRSITHDDAPDIPMGPMVKPGQLCLGPMHPSSFLFLRAFGGDPVRASLYHSMTVL